MPAYATSQTAVPASLGAPPRPRSGASLLILGLVLMLLIVSLLSLAVGTRAISPGDVLQVLLYPDGSETSAIVHTLRVPRTILGLVVGASLGVSGALLQTLTRNPLSDPGFLGVNSGAGLAVVFGISLGLTSFDAYVWLALLGAGVAVLAVYVLGSRGVGGAGPVKLVLTGAAIAAMCESLTSALVLHDSETLNQARLWMTGSIAGRDSHVLTSVAPFLLVGAVVAGLSWRGLERLMLGDDVARALGVHVGRTRGLTLLAATLLAGAATAAAGPIVFVGLVAPHLARRLTGLHSARLLPVSAVAGAVLLLVADVLGRVIARPGEVQVSIMTALVGAPFFVVLVRRRRLVST